MHGWDFIFVIIPLGVSALVGALAYVLLKFFLRLNLGVAILCAAAVFIVVAVVTLFIVPAPDF